MQEVDIIIKTPNFTIPVEVKYRDDATLTPTSGLAIYCQREKVSKGYWVTKREEDFDLVTLPGHATQYMRIPAHVFTYLLGRMGLPPELQKEIDVSMSVVERSRM